MAFRADATREFSLKLNVKRIKLSGELRHSIPTSPYSKVASLEIGLSKALNPPGEGKSQDGFGSDESWTYETIPQPYLTPDPISTDLVFTASGTSSSGVSMQEPSSTKKSVPKKEKITGGVSLKKSLAKKTKPKDTESNGEPQSIID